MKMEYTVERVSNGPCAFVVSGPEITSTSMVNAFLMALTIRDRSVYTIRSYAIGLAHFLSWLHDAGIPADAVTRRTIEDYITAFRYGSKGGACSVDTQRAGQIHTITRKVATTVRRKPSTINHRLSVLASYYDFRIRQDNEADSGPWRGRSNPVPASTDGSEGSHGMVGRDDPRRGRAGELRQRVPRRLPLQLDPEIADRLIETAVSWRDKALLTLLYRTGQRIGDWSEFAGRHGLLGMALTDVDERTRSITVLLKGARDEHRVPVTEDFWPLWKRYLADERRAAPECQAAWVGMRKGEGKPLTYATFESALRYVGAKIGVNVHAHLFRHTVAQAIVDQGKLKVAQELLGHAHVSTTADVYARVDQQALVEAVAKVQAAFEARVARSREGMPPPGTDYAFAYDESTLEELEQAATGRPPEKEVSS